MKKLLTVISATALASCATHPDEMTASYVSALNYKDFDCNQISTEMSYLDRRTQELYRSLKKKNEDDTVQMTVGMFALWPALLFLEGGDGPQATEYSRLKGEFNALYDVARYKQCGDIIQRIEMAQVLQKQPEAPKAEKYLPANPQIPQTPAHYCMRNKDTQYQYNACCSTRPGCPKIF